MESKSEKNLITTLIIISIVLIIFSFLSPLIFTANASNHRLNFNQTGPIGDTIGGLMNPFITLAGVFITFLAFYMQFRANNIQIKQFNENQKEQIHLLEEQQFFRLLDNLNQRIFNFSFSINNNAGPINISSYKALDNIINSFLNEIDNECLLLGKHILAKFPEDVSEHFFLNIIGKNRFGGDASIEEAKRIKQIIIDLNQYNDRWEYIKLFDKNYSASDCNNFFKSIGRVHFYKIDFKERYHIYVSVYGKVYNQYAAFLDGYMKNMTYLINFASNKKNVDFFIDYIKNNLSTQELILLFYYCASRRSSQIFRSQILKFNILDEIKLITDKFIDVPSEEEMQNEIENILNREHI
jgi:hypothetical protein